MSRFSAIGPGNSKRHSVAITGDPGKLLAAVGDLSAFKRTGFSVEHATSSDTGKLQGTGMEKTKKKEKKKDDNEEPMEEVQLRYDPSEIKAKILQRRSIDLRRRSRRSVTLSPATWNIIDEGLDILAKAFVKGTEPNLVPYDPSVDVPENPFESSGLTPYKLIMENYQEIERRVKEYSDGALNLIQCVPDMEWEAGLKEPGKRFLIQSKDKTKYQRLYVPPVGFKVCVSIVHTSQEVFEKGDQSQTPTKLNKKKSFFF